MAFNKIDRRVRIKHRIRKVVSGVAERPRMTVFRSNRHIYVQMVDDTKGITLVSASTGEKCFEGKLTGMNKVQQAAEVGKLIAQRSIEKGITAVAFDRNGYLYHGRVKMLADAAREGGLKF